MNRIILIGNGFDLAHGLPTSYRDFIEYYWKKRLLNMDWSYQHIDNDGLVTFNCNPNNSICINDLAELIEQIRIFYIDKNARQRILIYDPFIERINALYKGFDSKFFENINKTIKEKGWVDIENEYYQFLKRIVNHQSPPYNSPNILDDEFRIVKDELVKYLKEIKIVSGLEIKCIRKIIYEPFNARDISISGRKKFNEFLAARWSAAHDVDMPECKRLLYRFGFEPLYEIPMIAHHAAYCDLPQHIESIYNRLPNIHPYFGLPSDILLLNFNYTKTAHLYLEKKSSFKVNHIHGELENQDNKVIFGYGDELDEDYKKISNLNDNGYLTNIKSIRYLETDNYRKLLQFIDSAPYQIYIMGHSCGNSDRTLLNTLFEHKNCVSIKPFYHKKEDGSDNYIDLIQNISRNFNDMQMMRDRVVNKSYCRPLVEPEN